MVRRLHVAMIYKFFRTYKILWNVMMTNLAGQTSFEPFIFKLRPQWISRSRCHVGLENSWDMLSTIPENVGLQVEIQWNQQLKGKLHMTQNKFVSVSVCLYLYLSSDCMSVLPFSLSLYLPSKRHLTEAMIWSGKRPRLLTFPKPPRKSQQKSFKNQEGRSLERIVGGASETTRTTRMKCCWLQVKW